MNLINELEREDCRLYDTLVVALGKQTKTIVDAYLKSKNKNVVDQMIVARERILHRHIYYADGTTSELRATMNIEVPEQDG